MSNAAHPWWARWRPLLISNLFLATFYIATVGMIYPELGAELIAKTTDAKGYLSVANWLGGGADSDYAKIRPILYPAVITLATKLFGLKGIWVVQALMWLVTLNLCFISIRKLTGTSAIALLATLMLAANLSFIALTLHALSEITTAFLLAVLVYYLVQNRQRLAATPVSLGAVFLLALLTLTKPVFIWPLIGASTWVAYQLVSSTQRAKLVLGLCLALSPIIAQVSLMAVKYDRVMISEISSLTLKNYLFAQVYGEVHGLDWRQAKLAVVDMPDSELRSEVFSNLDILVPAIGKNIQNAIAGQPLMMRYSPEWRHSSLYRWMVAYNRVVFKIHLVFVFAIGVYAVRWFRGRSSDYYLVILMASMTFYLNATAGVSFFQGDRLTLPSWVVWIPLYCWIASQFARRVSDRFLSPPEKLG